jgi:excinuclease ABC subunit B
LIQTIGRAARNKDARVILYADSITNSMQEAIAETDRRREKQLKHNAEHNITPKSIKKGVSEHMANLTTKDAELEEKAGKKRRKQLDIHEEIEILTLQMNEAAANLDFEQAAALRDRIAILKNEA